MNHPAAPTYNYNTSLRHVRHHHRRNALSVGNNSFDTIHQNARLSAAPGVQRFEFPPTCTRCSYERNYNNNIQSSLSQRSANVPSPCTCNVQATREISNKLDEHNNFLHLRTKDIKYAVTIAGNANHAAHLQHSRALQQLQLENTALSNSLAHIANQINSLAAQFYGFHVFLHQMTISEYENQQARMSPDYGHVTEDREGLVDSKGAHPAAPGLASSQSRSVSPASTTGELLDLSDNEIEDDGDETSITSP